MSAPGRLLVFGDSLSDSGNFHDLSAAVLRVPLPPDSAGYAGRFSNGAVQSEVAAGLLGAALDNYAVGAARAVGSRTVGEYLAQNGFDDPDILLPDPDPGVLATDTWLGGQVGQYLADAAANPPDADTAAAFWIGANDYNALPPDATPAIVAQTVASVVGATIAAAGVVAASGVGRILLYDLPAPEFLPVPLPPEFALVVGAHNAALAQGAELLRGQGVDAEVVEVHRIAGEIVADAGTFGLDPAYLDQPMVLGIGSQPTWVDAIQDWFMPANPAVAGVDPDRLAFMDALHPSAATHGVLGSFVAASVAGNPVFGTGGDETIRTGPLDDLVLAGAGNDKVVSARGADIVLAGLGDDFVWAGSGRDIVAGGAGDDRLHGRSGNDVIAGSDGDDVQWGGAGRDLLVDGLGWDVIRGGSGNDAILYVEAELIGGSNADDGGRFDGGRGFDTLYLALDDATRAAVEGELQRGRAAQALDSIGVTTCSIERYVFVDPDDPAACIVTGARLAEADLWGFV